MNKILPLIIVGILIISGIGVAVSLEDDLEIFNKNERITFSKNLVIENKDGYLAVHQKGADSLSEESGKPMLPVYRKTFTFSSSVKIKEVICSYSEVDEKSIDGKIIPAPDVVPGFYPDANIREPLVYENKEIYESDAMFPGSWYDYDIRCGLNSKEVSTTFVTVEVHPVQYSPTKNMLYFISDVEIQISYNDPGINGMVSNVDSYDLVVITPETFSESLQPLIDHKNAHELKTFIKTTEEIYDEYTGRDKPEQIKYFIKDAKETLGVTYVLLVGGLKSYIYAKDKDDRNHGSTGWHVPVRYTNIQETDEKSVISDLYYSDLYRYNESLEELEFEDWDSNGDGIFAKISFMNSDKLDLLPDIYIGRLACRNKLEVKIMVDKIINYEATPPQEKPWFKRMIGVAGRTFDWYEGKLDGEYAVDTAFDYMGDLIEDQIRVYSSNNDTGGLVPDTKDIVSTFSEGAGYINFEGHGNPISWATHWAEPPGWTGGISITDFGNLNNGDKLPVVIVGGCHNALFNVSMLKILLTRKDHNYYWLWYPTPVCFSWGLCIIPKGGAIASTGCTGLGFGGSTPLSNSGGLDANFFYQIGQNGSSTLGSAHSGSIRKFVNENKVRVREAFCITEYQLFGDPSLKLGGYE